MENSSSEDRPLRVLHVYSGNMFGGIETILSTLATCREDAPEMKPEFALCFSGRLWEQLLDAGCIVHDLGQIRVSRPWSILQARRRLVRLLKEGGFDVVVTHACWVHALLGGAARRHVPVVFWGHDINYGKHWLEKWAARNVPTAVIANSKATQASIREHLFPDVPSDVLYCPIPQPFPLEPGRRSEIRAQFGANDETFVIVQAGRLERYKGQTVHLEALAQLPKDQPWQSWIIGGAQRDSEAEYLAELQELVARCDLTDRVYFLGQRRDVSDLLQAADAFCHPNVRAEPFGIVFIEALFAGLPVVATNIGGAQEIITDQCGLLAKPDDVDSVAEALQKLLTDASLRHSLSEQGPSRAAELCDAPKQLAKLQRILGAVAKGKQEALIHA